MGQAKRRELGQRIGTKVGLALALCLLALALLAVSAQAKEGRLPLGPLGSFTEPLGLAVDQSSHDVYAIGGRTEEQQITVSATAGKFKLKFGGKTTKDLPFNAAETEVRDALREAICGGATCVVVPYGQGNATGSNPYVIIFSGSLLTTDVEQIECAPGTIPLSGGSGCKVETTVPGVNGSISRYHANGTPSEFPALGSNAIDGLGGADLTPQKGLHFGLASTSQMALDESGGETAGEIYVTQGLLHVADIFAANGEFLGALSEFKEGPTASGPLKPLGKVCGVAVDGAGNVYVGDETNGIHKYAPSGKVVANADNVANFTTVSSSCALAAGAGPTAGSLFAVSFSGGKLFKLDASSGAVEYVFEEPVLNPETKVLENKISEGNTTITVDPKTGHVLAAAKRKIQEWDASGGGSATLLGSIEAGSHTNGVAVDASTAKGKGGTVYLSREKVSHLDVYGPIVVVPDVKTEAAGGIGPDAATLHGTISAAEGPESHCHFQYLTDATYQAQLKAAEETSEPKTAPELADAAFAGAQSAPCAPAGPFTGTGLNAVSANLEGLAHETAYRFRLIGESEEGQIAAEQALLFETFGKPKVKGSSFSEVTTTGAKISGEVNPGGQATSFTVEYVSQADFLKSGYNNAINVPEPAEAIGAGASFLEVSAQLSGLTPDTAYRFRIAASNADGTTLGKEGSFASFAAPEGLLDQRAWELVSPVPRIGGEVFTPERGPRDGLGGSCKVCTPGWGADKAPMQASPDGDAVAYEGDPFATGLASEANSYVSRRDAGGWQTAALSEPRFEAQDFKGFSPDLSKAVIEQVEPPLSAEAPPGYDDLYLREEGGDLTALITTKPPSRTPGKAADSFAVTYAGANAGTESVAPFTHVLLQANDALSEAVAGVAPKAPTVKAEETDLYEWSNGKLHLVNVLPGNEKAAPNAVIGWTPPSSTNFDFDHAISDDGSRVFWSTKSDGQVYVRESGTATTKVPDPGKFLTASADGSKVLLSDGVLYDLEAKTTTDLTNGAGGFQGVAGASEDLSRIYFVDTEALTGPEEKNAGGEAASKGAFNLYLSEEGALNFIAKLVAKDNTPGLSAWRAAPGNRLAQTTADGRFLAFESTAALTGYDNVERIERGCVGGDTTPRVEPCFEIFEYDALSGSLTCVSCNPSGQRPLGGSSLSLFETDLEFFPQPSNLPPAGEGRLFFQSLDTLTPADDNGRIQDVYEYEPSGVGSCERAKGCLSLVSAGSGPKDSWFIDASDTGRDAFFATHDQLLPADQNDFMDLYDARAGGGIEEPPLPTPCEGEGCKGPLPIVPEEPGAGSSTLQLEEPLPQKPRPCTKGKVRRHGKCLKRPRHPRHAHRKRGGNR